MRVLAVRTRRAVALSLSIPNMSSPASSSGIGGVSRDSPSRRAACPEQSNRRLRATSRTSTPAGPCSDRPWPACPGGRSAARLSADPPLLWKWRPPAATSGHSPPKRGRTPSPCAPGPGTRPRPGPRRPAYALQGRRKHPHARTPPRARRRGAGFACAATTLPRRRRPTGATGATSAASRTASAAAPPAVAARSADSPRPADVRTV